MANYVISTDSDVDLAPDVWEKFKGTQDSVQFFQARLDEAKAARDAMRLRMRRALGAMITRAGGTLGAQTITDVVTNGDNTVTIKTV